MIINQKQKEFLLNISRRYIWWKTPEEAILFPERLIAQVMNLGIWEDVVAMENVLPKETLQNVLKNAQAGWFDIKKWHMWHYRLDICELGNVPALPVRNFIK